MLYIRVVHYPLQSVELQVPWDSGMFRRGFVPEVNDTNDNFKL